MVSESSVVWRRGDTLEGRFSLSHVIMMNSRANQPMTMTAGGRRLSGGDTVDGVPAAAFDRTNAGFVGITKHIVEKHLANCEFNLEMLAQDLRVSRRQLFRKFNIFINCTPNAFIRDLRLNRAAQLLRESKMTILEITYAVGFSDPKYFRGVFREKFGMLPSAYARQFDSASSGSNNEPTENALK